MTYVPSGASGAPADATYITQTANGSLSAEQALSSLSTGLVKVTTGTGALSTATAGSDYLVTPLTADLDFAQYEALQFVIENRTSDPVAPVNGQLWLRTDL